MLINDIKKANMEALKNKDRVAKGIYSIIMNKYLLLQVEKREKNQEATDSDMIQIIQKTLKELEDEKASYALANKAEKVEEIVHQIETIKVYLPKMLSENEIKAEIAGLEDKSLPNVMKHFKANFAGKVDMSLVSKIARSL